MEGFTIFRQTIDRSTLFIFAGLVALLLAACAPATASPSPVASPTGNTPIVDPSEEPTFTPTPTTEPTTEPTAVPTEEPTAEPTAEPSAPSVSIDNLTPYAELSTGALTVSGSGEALFEGTVVVRVLSNTGEELASQPTIMEGENVGVGGAGTWQITLEPGVETGTRGIVQAYATSPRDGSIVASDAVNVIFGEAAQDAPYVTISQPDPGLTVPASGFTVEGMGGALFEGTVVLRVEDENGRELLTEPTILQGEDVGVGGEGTYSVALAVDVEPGTRGWIIAYSESARDGSRVAEAAIPVVFGE